MVSVFISLIPASLLALTHVILHTVEVKIEDKDGWKWLSVLSGIVGSYVFLGLIPDIDKYRYALDKSTDLEAKLDKRLYAILILIGFSIFFSIESLVRHNRKRKTLDMDDDIEYADIPILSPLPSDNPWIFAVHVIAFSLYGLVIALLLPQKFVLYGQTNMWFYYVAMQAHYIMDDMSLHDNFGKRYDKYGRFPLIVSTIAGFFIGVYINVPLAFTAGMASIIAGGTIFNTLKTELPADTKASVPLFLLGIVVYSILIVFLY